MQSSPVVIPKGVVSATRETYSLRPRVETAPGDVDIPAAPVNMLIVTMVMVMMVTAILGNDIALASLRKSMSLLITKITALLELESSCKLS